MTERVFFYALEAERSELSLRAAMLKKEEIVSAREKRLSECEVRE